MDKRTDKRVKKTKEKLRQSLLCILEKETISAVTVSELCAKAKVNRNTFYSHYVIPGDILNEICDEFIQACNESLTGADISKKSTVDKLTAIFDYSKSHKETFSVLLSDNCENVFISRLKHVVINLMIERHYPNRYNEYIEYDIEFNFYGTISVLIKWLNNGCREKSSAVADFIYSLCNHNEAMKRFR